MELTKEAIMEYQQLFQTTYGREIPYQDAKDQGEKLVQLVRLVLKPYQLAKHIKEVNRKHGNPSNG